MVNPCAASAVFPAYALLFVTVHPAVMSESIGNPRAGLIRRYRETDCFNHFMPPSL